MDSPSQAACSARSSLAPQGRASRRRASAARPAVRLASLTVSLRSAAVLQASKRPASKGGDNVRKPMAAAGTAVFFVLAPGVVAGLLPWWLTGWRVRQPLPWWAWAPLRVAGGVLIAAGVAVLVTAFVRFVAEGAGTPAPAAPTQHLVIGGLYRYVRNPMYLAVVATIVGQALVLGQPALLLYAAAAGAAMAAFVHGYEEPTLRRQFGAQYQAYQRAVPAWWPRRRPWQPDQTDQPYRHSACPVTPGAIRLDNCRSCMPPRHAEIAVRLRHGALAISAHLRCRRHSAAIHSNTEAKARTERHALSPSDRHRLARIVTIPRSHRVAYRGLACRAIALSGCSWSRRR